MKLVRLTDILQSRLADRGFVKPNLLRFEAVRWAEASDGQVVQRERYRAARAGSGADRA